MAAKRAAWPAILGVATAERIAVSHWLCAAPILPGREAHFLGTR
jgi:hypothetical protein